MKRMVNSTRGLDFVLITDRKICEAKLTDYNNTGS